MISLKRLCAHPFLIASYAVLALLANNISQVESWVVFRLKQPEMLAQVCNLASTALLILPVYQPFVDALEKMGFYVPTCNRR